MNMTSEHEAYVYVQIPRTLTPVPAIGYNQETARNGIFMRSKAYTRRKLSPILELSGRFRQFIPCYV